jgi:hypothetical protein
MEGGEMNGDWDGTTERRHIKWDDVVGHMASTNTKLDGIHEKLTEMSDKIKTQNGRIGTLEIRQYLVMGAGAFIVFVLELFFKH